MINNLTISIYESQDEPEYLYDIYNCEPSEVDDADPLDGGMCTTTIENALEMATEQAKALLKADALIFLSPKQQAVLKKPCPVCGSPLQQFGDLADFNHDLIGCQNSACPFVLMFDGTRLDN